MESALPALKVSLLAMKHLFMTADIIW